MSKLNKIIRGVSPKEAARRQLARKKAMATQRKLNKLATKKALLDELRKIKLIEKKMKNAKRTLAAIKIQRAVRKRRENIRREMTRLMKKSTPS